MWKTKQRLFAQDILTNMKAILILLLFITCVRAGNIFSSEKSSAVVSREEAEQARVEQQRWALEQERLADELQRDRDEERFLQVEANHERERLEQTRSQSATQVRERLRQLQVQRETEREQEVLRQRETEHNARLVQHAEDVKRAKYRQKELRRAGAPVKEHIKQKTRIRQLKANPPTMIDPPPRFGDFTCMTCGNKWSSANAYQGFYQNCRGCPEKTANLPISLKPLERSDEEGFSNGPHQSGDCERCQLGLSCRGRRFR